MIKHHPHLSLLRTYCAGELPASVSVIIAAHIELCPHCQQQVEVITKEFANDAFTPSFDSISTDSDFDGFDLDSMIDSITTDTAITELEPITPVELTLNSQEYFLPQVLRNLDRSNWSKLGKLSRSRIDLDDENLHTSLLHIESEGSVPSHTHNGFEVTLLLEGSFEDEMGSYHEGDFIWLDGKHTHNPVTKEGCLCLTVASDSLHFTQGLTKMLNPIGKFIY
jgi:putative transcriptional regulator